MTLSSLVLGHSHSWRIYASLLPIMLGVVVSSVSLSELEFNGVGLAAALFSMASLSSQTIFSKKLMAGGSNSVRHPPLYLPPRACARP